jgi:hypothetical protein
MHSFGMRGKSRDLAGLCHEFRLVVTSLIRHFYREYLYYKSITLGYSIPTSTRAILFANSGSINNASPLPMHHDGGN